MHIIITRSQSVSYSKIPATSLPPHRQQVRRYTGASGISALVAWRDIRPQPRMPNEGSVTGCQVACAIRGVDVCDGMVQGCIREKHESMVQGARQRRKQGEIAMTDLSRTTAPKSSRPESKTCSRQIPKVD